MRSFGTEMDVVVVGASGGIGQALTRRLLATPAVARVVACSRRRPELTDPRARWCRIDVTDEASVAEAARSVEHGSAGLSLVLVATGILHDGEALRPERTWRSLERPALERAYLVNAVGPALVAKHFLPLLARGRKSAFAALSARVGSITDNRLGGWHAYRASKAALNMLLRTLAIELARRNPQALCVGLHPGTVATPLSAPFHAGVPAGRLLTPDLAASRLLEVLDALSPADSGRVLAWDGRPVPP